MKQLFIIVITATFFLSFTCFNQNTETELIFFTHFTVSDTELSNGQIEDIYYGDKTTWSNRNNVIPTYLGNDGDASAIFYKNIIGLNSIQYNRYWIKLIFSGYSQAPKQFGTTQQLIDYVNSTKGAIGFVNVKDKDKLKSNCVILKIK